MLIRTTAIALSAALPAAAQDLIVEPGTEGLSWDSYEAFAAEYDLSGETITMTGTATGDDKVRLENVLAYFEAATGATVETSGSDSFEQDIVISVEAGTPPDVASFPQPGLLGELARQGAIVPLGVETAEWVRDTYAAGDSWVDLATFEGPDGPALYGIFFTTDVKSLVWYVPEQFEEAGYEVPETMEALKALSDRIVEDGAAPWCIGLASGAATGWPATDWVEEMVLRTQPPEVYDQWVAHEIPFDDPRIVAAIEEYGAFARNPDYTPGGPEGVASTDFRDAPAGLFSFPPECYMHRQASFIPAFFPEDAELGTDVDFFYFPAYEGEDLGTPVLGSGGAWAILQDSPTARALMEFVKTPIAHEVYAVQGSFLTPHTGINTDAYPTDTQRALADILTNATTFRYDASDLMPAEIGTSAFWSGMVDYTTGAPAEEVAGRIEEAWSRID